MATSKPNPQRKQPRPGAKPAGRKKPARRVDASRRSLAVLAAVCALALAAGFLLEEFMPRGIEAAGEEVVSKIGRASCRERV